MSYLLALSLGPVQDFIAAARRTQDLQAGSALLVKIAKSAAASIQADGGALIFPENLEHDGPNKILAEIPDGKAPPEIVKSARRAAEACLRDAWDKAQRELPTGTVDVELAKAQIDGFLEFYAAWVPYDPATPSAYGTARTDVDRLLAGRKALRDFAPPVSEAGRPKSPLDPSRDCVLSRLRDLQTSDSDTYRGKPLWLKKSEMLDAVSILKRIEGVVGRENMTPSTSFMAAKAILPQIQKKAPEVIQYLKEMVKKAQEVAGPGVDEGDFLFPGRLDADEIKRHVGDTAHLEHLHALLRKARVPECPYYAILVADGDKMGALLGHKSLNHPAQHREISKALALFAEAVKTIVSSCDGHLIYAGGDDVLALLPVNRALDCAAALALAFETQMAGFKKEEGMEGGTLSAGIAIVHHMDPLRVSLDRARAAEKEAKKTRNALAVALHTRGGEPLTVSHPWQNCREDWRQWIEAFGKDRLARGFPYELRGLAREFIGLSDDADVLKRLPDEAARILQRKKDGSAEGKKMTLPKAVTKNSQLLEDFAKQLVIARFLADYEFADYEFANSEFTEGNHG